MQVYRNGKRITRPGDKVAEIAALPVFRLIHWLVMITCMVTGLIGSVMYNDGFSIIPSITGVLVSGITVLGVIDGWKKHYWTGNRELLLSIALYTVGVVDEWGAMLAKGLGGELASGYFAVYMPTSILIILALWVALVIFSGSYSDKRREIELERKELHYAQQIQFAQRQNRLSNKREKLMAEELARRGRMLTLQKLYEQVMKRLYSASTRRKLKHGAQDEVNKLLSTIGVDPTQRKLFSSKKTKLRNAGTIEWTVSGDGATVGKP